METIMRDLDKNPYTPDEERVAKFLVDKGVGRDDDPIGFLMASYDYLTYTKQIMTNALMSHKSDSK
jgi:hypothetical protein